MKQVIVSTSTSCLDYLGKPANVRMLPMNILVGDTHHLDGQNLDIDKLSRMLIDNPNANITTSAPTETQLIDFFYQLIKEDIEEVLFICLSSHLSQTYQNLLNVQSLFAHRIKLYIYDSRSISHGETILVEAASKMLEAGMAIPNIISEINKIREKTSMFMTVDNLRGMIRTKRISAPAGFFANLLNIKPIVKLEDSGELVPYEKVRSFEKCMERLTEIIATQARGKEGKMYLFCSPLNPYIRTILNLLTRLGYANTPVLPIASVSLANVGVSTLGVMFVED